MSDLPPLTLLLGPQTSVSLGVNALIRNNRPVLVRGGLNALPSRLASPILRHATDARPDFERREEFAAAVGQGASFLAALNFFGPPQAGLMKHEMFPWAEASLARLAEVAPTARIVLSVDILTSFFLAAGSEPLETRVQRTPWEALYELCWSDLAHEINEALPNAELIVLTPTAVASAETTSTLFGDATAHLPDANLLLRDQISETGRAVLDRLVSENQCNNATLSELYGSFAVRPTQSQITERLGIDKVTQALLEQRFEEDLDVLSSMPDTRVMA